METSYQIRSAYRDDWQDAMGLAWKTFLRFEADEIPEKKKAAVGVRLMKLSDTDCLEGVCLFEKGSEPTILYKEKEVPVQRLKAAGRDQKGTKIRI